jgi:hypothetical protein
VFYSPVNPGRFNVIRLTYRLYGSWTVLGDVSIRSRRLDAEIEELMQVARRVHPGPLVTDVWLPRSHVRFEIVTWHDDEQTRQENIMRKLAELAATGTGELAHDWAPDRGLIRLAVVERLTLLEAERFAIQHGLTSASFTARALGRDFPRAPVFSISGRS